ncbi:MAG: hypothetical protein HY506_01835 [Candidatus Yanofskybacteria bacterium]|nr:hypothetical protein [Candidatus Yanofskybacteria bacterium]
MFENKKTNVENEIDNITLEIREAVSGWCDGLKQLEARDLEKLLRYVLENHADNLGQLTKLLEESGIQSIRLVEANYSRNVPEINLYVWGVNGDQRKHMLSLIHTYGSQIALLHLAQGNIIETVYIPVDGIEDTKQDLSGKDPFVVRRIENYISGGSTLALSPGYIHAVSKENPEETISSIVASATPPDIVTFTQKEEDGRIILVPDQNERT